MFSLHVSTFAGLARHLGPKFCWLHCTFVVPEAHSSIFARYVMVRVRAQAGYLLFFCVSEKQINCN